MLTSNILLPLSLTVATVAATTYTPWEITHLTTFAPSGRPDSSPWSSINITISDPANLAALSSPQPVSCVGKWELYHPPYGQTFNCSAVERGSWSFQMLESTSGYASPVFDFLLRFVLTVPSTSKRRRTDETGEQVYVSTTRFAAGENMRAVCGASGVCSSELKEELIPFAVVPKREHK